MKIKEKASLHIAFKMLASGHAIIPKAETIVFPTNSEVNITFEGVNIPEDAQLVITSGEHTYYRGIASGAAAINGSLLKGTTKMSISSRSANKIWKCEGTHFSALDSARTLFLPYDLDSHKICRHLLLRLDEAEKQIVMQGQEIKKLETRLNEYMEHWDIV